MLSLASRVYAALAPVAKDDAANNNSLAVYIGALGDNLLQEIDDYASEGPLGQTGWSSLVDLNRIPDKGLPWLAQFVGVQLAAGLTPAQQRAAIAATDGWRRGTTLAMAQAIIPTLTGTQSVTFRERDPAVTPNDPAYGLTVITRTSETPNSAASLAALLTQKPMGIVLVYTVLAGLDYTLLLTDSPLYSNVFSNYLTYGGVLTGVHGT
jgi:hypothetical protein